ncbi:hypothetical protein OHR68_30365 [Spirillospora sp. NBC_00431]
MAGNFHAARIQFSDQGTNQGDARVKIYWTPLHASSKPWTGPRLTVHLTRLSGTRITRTLHQPTVAHGADGRSFYPTDTPIPAPGRWKLEASTGQDTGCFIVTFT